MSRFEPFEPAPRIAVGVSGGVDSVALCLLLHRWVGERGGAVVALTVDHGLRREAAAEAAQVVKTLKPLGLEHRVLRWRGSKPTSNVQAAARRARYDLLTAWCARHGVLHLALGHQLDDQAETLLLRLARGSGLEGLAAMAPVSELPELRLLRPLLAVPRARLEAILAARGIPWIEDPANRDPAQARARLRRLMPGLAREGLTADRLAAGAGHLGRARAALELAVARLLVRAVPIHPAGFAWLDPGPVIAAPAEIGLRALARVLITVGGLDYTPRLQRLERLYGRIAGGLDRGATLGGCRIVPRRGRLLVVREPRGAPERAVQAGARLLWDGRFEIAVGGRGRTTVSGWSIGPLGAAGWAEVCRAAPELRRSPIPAPARLALPSLCDASGVAAVPYVAFRRGGGASLTMKSCRFAPKHGLAVRVFTVA